MENILVYATPFEIEKGKWGYKWIGFCYEKRFSVIFNPYETEMIIDTENGNYLFYEKGARRIYAYTEDYNVSSQKLCEKLGMRREGMFKEFITFINDEDGNPIYENTIQ